MANLYNKKYYHRDLSWLRFNHRVLQEAADSRNTLYERIKFLAIFSSNLDEFFKVRVSDIRQIKNVEKPLRKKLITKPNKALKEIKKQVELLQEEFGNIFRNAIIPELESNQIFLINHTQFSEVHKEIVKSYFEDLLKHKTSISIIPFNKTETVFIKNESLYLVSPLDDSNFLLVEIPESVDRFFVFPNYNGKYYITFIDHILKYCFKQNPEKEKDLAFYAIKKSRDAELYIEEEVSGNLKDKIEQSLSKRETGESTRFLIDKNIPKDFLNKLLIHFDASNADIIQGGIYHNFKDFFKFPNPIGEQLETPKLEVIEPTILRNSASIFDAVKEKDHLFYYPYHSFKPVIKWLQEAAKDPFVKKIKITIYRAASQSRLLESIVEATSQGKEVVVFIEVKARFDEANNIAWGKVLESKGANVIYSFPDIKVHSKILYIEREINGNTESYGYISTGNFNEKTAKIYTDFAIMTAHPEITQDLNKVFLTLEGKLIIPKTKKLLVAPFTARDTFENFIRNEIEIAKRGKPAYIIAKMNSLEDKSMIKLLYQASNAGVQIRLLVRGICCLVPGIKNQSENIYITSIVDQFLEHGRIYLFGNNGKEKMFFGSADWMKRNLSHRIEVITPVLDKEIHKILKELLEIQLADNIKARIIDEYQQNNYVDNPHGEQIQSQLVIHNYLKKINL